MTERAEQAEVLAAKAHRHGMVSAWVQYGMVCINALAIFCFHYWYNLTAALFCGVFVFLHVRLARKSQARYLAAAQEIRADRDATLDHYFHRCILQ